MTKFSFLTDVHYGVDMPHNNIFGNKAPLLLETFSGAAQRHGAEFNIHGGDHITYTMMDSASGMRDGDLRNLDEITQKLLSSVAVPSFLSVGNHDLKTMTPEDFRRVTGYSARNYSADMNGLHLVFLNGAMEEYYNTGPSVTREDMKWLKADLESHQDMPAVVITHIPLDNLGPERRADTKENYDEAPEVRQIIEAAENVVLCLSGHDHVSRLTQFNHVPYFTLEPFSKHHMHDNAGDVTAAYGLIDLDFDNRTIKIDTVGAADQTVQIAFPAGYKLTP